MFIIMEGQRVQYSIYVIMYFSPFLMRYLFNVKTEMLNVKSAIESSKIVWKHLLSFVTPIGFR